MDSRFFLVTSRGQCGTRWLARALNSHRGIVCSHGPGEVDVALNYDRLPTDEERRRNIEADTERRLKTLAVGDVFAELAQAGAGPAFGNVHMYTLRTLAESVRRRPVTMGFRLVNLVRHPVSWLQSASHNQATAMGVSSVLFERRKSFYSTNKELCDRLTSPYGVDPLDPSNLAFLGCCLGSLPGFASEVATPGIVHVPMERMTSDRSYFSALVEALVGADFPSESDWLDQVFSMGPTNAHAPAGPKGPQARFNAWPRWKQAAFEYLLSCVQGLKHFERLGYDLSFARPAVGASAQRASL